jgi:Flp pilus assembly pilin Flp
MCLKELLQSIWSNDDGQDVAEYAVMVAVILVIVIGTVKLVGGKSNNVFSEVASSIDNYPLSSRLPPHFI